MERYIPKILLLIAGMTMACTSRADVYYYNSNATKAYVPVSTLTTLHVHRWVHETLIVNFSGTLETLTNDYNFELPELTQLSTDTYEVGPGEWLTLQDLYGAEDYDWEWNSVDNYVMTRLITDTQSSISGLVTFDPPSSDPTDPIPVILTPNASISPGSINDGESVVITRDGSATRGIAWTEATVWAPDGSYDVLGNSGLGSSVYTPHNGPGVYSLQFRLVDNDINYADQWVTFAVN